MNTHRLQTDPIVTDLVVLEAGESVRPTLVDYIKTRQITAGRLSVGIGAFETATLAFFDVESSAYDEIAINEQTEVVTLHGTVAEYEDAPKLHLHAMLSRRDGSCVGGHFVDAVVNPTLEVLVTSFPRTLHRHTDPTTGLPLLS